MLLLPLLAVQCRKEKPNEVPCATEHLFPKKSSSDFPEPTLEFYFFLVDNNGINLFPMDVQPPYYIDPCSFKAHTVNTASIGAFSCRQDECIFGVSEELWVIYTDLGFKEKSEYVYYVNFGDIQDSIVLKFDDVVYSQKGLIDTLIWGADTLYNYHSENKIKVYDLRNNKRISI